MTFEKKPIRPATVLIGAQFGDEGKGKLVDFLSEKFDIVVRYQGGANAGHTICFDDKTIVLHLIPSGIFNPKCVCVIGNGVVIDADALLKEIETVKHFGVDITGRLLISHNAHLIMPYHKLLDSLTEQSRSGERIGTTMRGIGPSYVDKFSRIGIRIVDLLSPEILEEKLRSNLEQKNTLLQKVYSNEGIQVEELVRHYTHFDHTIDAFVKNTQMYLNDQIKLGKSVLLEGAQGSLLDVDHGTYPFVTSSNPTSGGACTGSGIPPTYIGNVIGVAKAYMTRVGNGSFPTELHDTTGEEIRKIGHEFGATTGRPRRCGWLDLPLLKYANTINGVTEIALTKLDVLDSFPEVKVCTHYTLNGKMLDYFPTDHYTLSRVEPVYVTLPGWQVSNRNAKHLSDLHHHTRSFIEFVESALKLPVTFISVGPKRDETVFK